MRRSLARILVVVAVLAAAAAVGLGVARLLSPERLREMAERRLAEVTRHPVSIGRVQLALGVGFQLRGEDVRLWPRPGGPGLRVEHVGAGVEPLSLLTGRLRLRRMAVEGAELRIEQASDGRFHAPFGFLDPREPAPSAHPEEILQPLIALESAMRFLLRRPYLADSLRVESSHVLLELGEGGGARVFSLAIREGELRHRRLRGDAVLRLEGRLGDAAGELAEVRWTGLRDRSGQLRVAFGFSALELSGLEKYVRTLQPRAGLAGRARGTLAFASSQSGYGRLDVDLAFDDLEARMLEETAWGPLRADHLDAGAALEITPQRVGLESARVASGGLELEVAGTLERPLRPASAAGLELTFRDLDVGEVRALLDWLPYTQADEFETFMAPVRSGRMRTFTARGRAALSEWEGFFAGRRPIVAMGIGAEADFSDVVLAVGESNRIEGLGARVSWSPDRVEVRDARAALNGEPLPSLDLRFEGVSHMLAAAPERRRLTAGALPLPGVSPLWRVLAGEAAEDDEPATSLAVELEIDWLHHPGFVWPLESLRVGVHSEKGGLRLAIEQGTWAGVPIHGEADWLFEPEPRAHVTLRASAPEPEAPALPKGRGWARGRFHVGALEHPRWRQAGGRGGFSAAAGTVELHDLELDLRPAGRVTGSGSLDLSERAAVPFRLSVALARGDVDALIRLLEPGHEVATGRVDAWGSFEGSLRPGRSPFADLSGLLEIAAADGRIRRSLPPIVAIALASEGLNPFAERDSIRYRSVETLLDFREGRVFADELSIDGPDVRVLASGEVELLDEAHEIRAEVALFLFRQLDRAVGTIPVINLLLLGADQNLLAAYFELRGPWREPRSRLVPLKSLASGPASLVFQGVPAIVERGVRAIESMMGGDGQPNEKREEPAPAPWEETPWGS